MIGSSGGSRGGQGAMAPQTDDRLKKSCKSSRRRDVSTYLPAYSLGVEGAAILAPHLLARDSICYSALYAIARPSVLSGG